MTRLRPLRLPLACAAAVAMLPAVCRAQSNAPPQTLRLSDAEKADLLSHHSEASVDAARAGLDGAGQPDRQIHGEIGAMIGTHGARGLYGTAAIPFSDSAGAIVSFETSHFGNPR